MKNPYSDKELFELAAAGMMSGATAIAGAQLNLPPNLINAVGIILPMLSLGFGRGAYQLWAGRVLGFSGGYLRGLDADPARAEKKAKAQSEKLADDSNYHETMFRSFRLMMDAVDETVIPILGILAAQYNERGCRPDPHFRALGRLLCDLEAGELEMMTSMLTGIEVAAESLRTNPDTVEVSIDPHGSLELTSESASLMIGKPYEFAQAPRLFMLLKRDGLANQKIPGARYGTPPQETIALDTEIVRRILVTIDVEGHPWPPPSGN